MDPASRQITTPYPDFTNAACKGKPIEHFYETKVPQSHGERMKFTERQRMTIELCSSCPVQEECLDYALKAEPYGIWGGTTESEREYLRVRLGIECERDVLISRNARRARLSMHSPLTMTTTSMAFERSQIVKKRMLRA